MRTFDFSLIFEPFTPDDEDVAEALYAQIDDALFGICSGVAQLDFAREANSLDDAIISALDDVQAVGLGLRVAKVEPDESTRQASGKLADPGRDARTIAAVNAALELARWHGKPGLALQFLQPSAP